jgi:hypothetical protein
MADDTTIRVKRPDGRYSRIPISSMQAAIAKGYKPAPGSPEGNEQAKRSAFSLTTGIPPTPGGVASWEAGELAGGVGDALGGIGKMVFQSPQSTTEKVIAPMPGALQVKRLLEGMTEPLTHVGEVPDAIRDLKKSGVGIPSLALQVPRTMANLATMYETGRVMQPGVDSLAGKVADKTVQTPVRVAMQKIAGAGKEPVLLEAMKRQKAVKKWLNDSMGVKRAEAEKARVDAKRESLTRGQEAYSKRLLDNIQQTYKTVKGQLDSRWHGLRTTPINRGGTLSVLKDELLNSRAIADSVETAEKKYLQGSPESIKQFRDLMNWMKEDQTVYDSSQILERPITGTEAKLKPITWDEARTHYSALGDRMYSGDLPGNIVQAIRSVREGLGKELQAGAERGGAGEKYSGLLKDWSNFESDWKDTSSVSLGGGSPLARALKAPSATLLTPQVLGKTGDLLMERMGRYKEHGASPATAQAIRKLHTTAKNLPNVKVPEAPSPVPPIDPVAIRRKILTSYAGRPVEFRDFINPARWVERPALSSEAIRQWVAKQPRRELEP